MLSVAMIKIASSSCSESSPFDLYKAPGSEDPNAYKPYIFKKQAQGNTKMPGEKKLMVKWEKSSYLIPIFHICLVMFPELMQALSWSSLLSSFPEQNMSTYHCAWEAWTSQEYFSNPGLVFSLTISEGEKRPFVASSQKLYIGLT